MGDPPGIYRPVAVGTWFMERTTPIIPLCNGEVVGKVRVVQAVVGTYAGQVPQHRQLGFVVVES